MNRPTTVGSLPTSNGITSKSIVNSVQRVWRRYRDIMGSVDLGGRSLVEWEMGVAESKKRAASVRLGDVQCAGNEGCPGIL